MIFNAIMLLIGLGGCLAGRLYMRQRIGVRALWRLTTGGMLLTVLVVVVQIIFGEA